jgi:hypothetical protein
LDSTDAILLETEDTLEQYFWCRPQAVSPGNSYWMEAARIGGGYKINNPVLKNI